MKNLPKGKLYGIGVGPGDPELIPLKSIKILQKVDVIFAAASTRNTYSRAVDIAKVFLPAGAELKLLSFPMTKDRREKSHAWQCHAETILAVLDNGKSAAFLTLGDPLTYSTYGYILKAIQAICPGALIETVPGIASYQAAAARVNIPLVAGEESLMVISGVEGGRLIRKYSPLVDNIIILKAYRNAADIATALDETGMIDTSIGISNCSRDNEEIISDLRDLPRKQPGYWTLIIAKKSRKESETAGRIQNRPW